MADGVLKAFLVTLAYEVDRATEQRFTSSVTGATKVVTGLGEAVAAVATAVTVGVDLMTQRFEKLYYSSQRTGASAGHIKAFGFAVGQMGSSAEAGQAALESFTRTLREAPSRFAQLRDLGVRVADNNGKIRDTVALLTDFGAVLSKKDYYVGLQYAAQYGIDEDTYRALRRTNELRAYAREYRDKMKAAGLDPETASRQSMEFQNVWRSMWASVDVITSRVAESFIKNLKGPFEEFTRLIDRSAPAIVAVFDKISAAALELGTYLLEKVSSKEFQDWVDWVCRPETWKGFLDTLGTIRDIFVEVWKTAEKLFTGIQNFLGSPAARFFTDPAGLGKQAGEAVFGEGGAAGAAGRATGGIGGWWKDHAPSWLGGGASGGKETKPQQNANSAAAMDELRKAGYNDNAIAAVLGSMQTESGFRPSVVNSSGHHGLWQWDANQRWPKIERWIKSQGGDPNDARWQTKAWIAEHNAKPGDPIYDNRNTEAGGRLLRANPDIGTAVHGVQMSERFGPGEEGGRAANARGWLPKVAAGGQPSTISKIAGAARAIVTPSAAEAAEDSRKGFNEAMARKTPYGDLSRVPPATAAGSSSTTNNKNNDVDQHNHTTVNMYGFAGHDMAQAGYKVGEHINNQQGNAVRSLVGAIE